MPRHVFVGDAVHLKQSPCPVCGHKLDGLTPAKFDTPPAKQDDWVPTNTSFSICIYCASMLRFEGERKLRKVTPEDLVELLNAEPELFSLLHKMADFANGMIRDRQRKNYRKN